MRVSICTGGGDAPGLNAAIRAVVLSAVNRRWEVLGIRQGFDGLLGAAQVVSLDRESVRGITHVGGTILGTSNRGNPFRWPELQTDGTWSERDRSDELIAAFNGLELDALVALGGDGTLKIAFQLWKKGLPVVGVPKTIDNDVGGTVGTFGFDTAVQTATEAIDKIHSTAEAHRRVMVVEVMGRYAGWIALRSGLAGSADVILIPEIPFDLEKVCDKVRAREAAGRHFSIVVVAEGAAGQGGTATVKSAAVSGGEERLGGVSELVARYVTKHTGKETRTLTLGHLQRGGSPTTLDRVLALRLGSAAARAVEAGLFGHMVALHPPDIVTVALEDVLDKPHRVPAESDVIQTARALGISFGD